MVWYFNGTVNGTFNYFIALIYYFINSDLIASWASLTEGSLQFISGIPKADNAKYNKIRSLGDRQFC